VTSSDPDWVFERKLDGVRCLVLKDGNQVRLLSRNRKDMRRTWPELVEAIESQERSFVVDGEIVAFERRHESRAADTKAVDRAIGSSSSADAGRSSSSCWIRPESWWRRSVSPNGPRTTECGTRASSECDATSERKR
jgi:ATP-dependent DNA ligase